MASSEVLDFDRLLAPISDEMPAGKPLRDEPTTSMLYFQVKDAREAARIAERKKLQRSMMTEEEREHDPDGEPTVDWDAVCEPAEVAIGQHSKDLWICAWWIEGLTRRHGFAGLRDGFRLVRELIEKYWDEIHPRPDEDGVATTVAQLSGLNGEDSAGALIRPIEQVPLTLDPKLTSADYEDALEATKKTGGGDTDNAGVLHWEEFAEFKRSINGTSTEFFENLLEDIAAAREEFEKLEVVLETKCGEADGFSAAPPTSNIRSALEAAEDRLRMLTRSILGPVDEPSDEPEEGDVEEGAMVATGGSTQSMTDGAVRNREEAFRVLLKVAEYFHSTEPHSPVSYALEQAVRWGRMTLPELMKDLVSDEQARSEMFRRAGIPIPEDD